MKTSKALGLLAVLGIGGYVAYDFFMAGYHTRPAMPEGAWSISFKNGLRAIIVGFSEDDSRRYLSFPMQVPFYLEDSWSWCKAPTVEELKQGTEFMAERNWPGQKLEAVCKIDVEGTEVVRGLLISVPRV